MTSFGPGKSPANRCCAPPAAHPRSFWCTHCSKKRPPARGSISLEVLQKPTTTSSSAERRQHVPCSTSESDAHRRPSPDHSTLWKWVFNPRISSSVSHRASLFTHSSFADGSSLSRRKSPNRLMPKEHDEQSGKRRRPPYSGKQNVESPSPAAKDGSVIGPTPRKLSEAFA